MRSVFLMASVLAALCLAPAAQAARVPTRAESATLKAFLRGQVGNHCDKALKRSTPLPLITDSGRWGVVEQVCEYTDPPSGAGTNAWAVWGHRTSAGWTVARAGNASRVPPCTGADGLLNSVPRSVVDELREACNDPGKISTRPQRFGSLDLFRNAGHELDDIGPSVGLSAPDGGFSISRDGPPLDDGPDPTLDSMTGALGAPRRVGCRAHWPRSFLWATACDGHVTQLTLTSHWRLEADEQAVPHPMAQTGDPLSLVHYLDPRLRKLGANGRHLMAHLRIGTADVTVTAVTRRGRLAGFDIGVRQV